MKEKKVGQNVSEAGSGEGGRELGKSGGGEVNHAGLKDNQNREDRSAKALNIRKPAVGREERDPGGAGKEASLGREQRANSACSFTLRIWPRLQGKAGATVGFWAEAWSSEVWCGLSGFIVKKGW